MQALTIGRTAREAGVTVETIRFYERRGLIEQPPKGTGFRVYSADQVARIRFIKQAQQIGFSLSEIGELLTLRADPSADCAEVRQQAVAKLNEVHRKIEQLQQVGTALETLITACPGSGGLQACSIMDGLALPTNKSSFVEKRPRSHSLKHLTPEHRMKTAIFKIDGMHCDSCANTIKALVEKQPGVQMAAVSFDDSQARILYDPQTIGEDRLVAVVQQPGFRVVGR